MPVYFCREFIRDLIEHGDANFASRVLGKVISPEGEFEPDADDHRFRGVDNCWIRYVSRKTTAYRAIFIRRGGDVYWYRAGGHSIENNIRAPQELDTAMRMGEAPEGLDALTEYRNPRYTKSTHPRYLREVLASRVLVPHRNVTLVSPRLSTALFSPVGLVGRLIASTVELNGTVSVITRPPGNRELDQYRWLSTRGVDLLIHERINARLFYFEIDREQLDPELSHLQNIAIIGSAELTERGLNLHLEDKPDEELCYEIASDDLDGSMEFFFRLASDSVDLQTHVGRAALS
jgi:hypothetical protein